MKAALLSSATVFILLLATTAFPQNLELTKLGSSAFSVDAASLSSGYTQSTNALTFTAFNAAGSDNYLAGSFSAGPLDWSAYTNAPYVGFALNMSFSGNNPDTSFSLDLIDSSFNTIATYTGTTDGLGGSPTLVNLTLGTVGTGAYNDVLALGFTWDGAMSPPNTVTIESVYAVVPEPSTYALVVLSGIALVGCLIRRRA